MITQKVVVALIGIAFLSSAVAQDPQPSVGRYLIESNIPYRDDSSDEYCRDRCRLDVYHPVGKKSLATIVWFHGGGLTSGEKSIPEGLKNQDLTIVSANYRLSPKAKAPAYIEDAAAAVAWTFRNIEKYGGAPNRIIVSGHSAGGYLANMIGLDKQYLAAHNIDSNRIAAIVPYSGQAITHFTIREEKGIDRKQPIVDQYAPIFHVRKDAPPVLLISGDRNMELLGRYEETAYLWRMMKEVGHEKTTLYELQGFDHGNMVEAGHPLLLRFIKDVLK